MTEPAAIKYRAFISYSHDDAAAAKWLHRALESHRIDRDLVGRETATGTIPSALRPIFRDRDDFTAGHTLTNQTLAALDASEALIVMCSPAAAKSHYVNEEVRLFKSRHPDRPVIPLIVAGTPGDAADECFPPAVRYRVDAKGRVGKRRIEVLAADIREQGEGKSLALAKVVAGLLGVSSDDVFRRAERERRRKGRLRNGIVAALGILVIATSASAAYAWQQLKTNEQFLNATLKRATEIVKTAVVQAETYGVPRKATLELLGRADGLFEDMARLGRPTPELRFRRSRMLLAFASNYEILGDTKTWKTRTEEAHEILLTLGADHPGNSDYRSGLIEAEDQLGRVYVAQGNLPEALRLFRHGLALGKEQVAAEPDNAKWQSELAGAHDNVGDVLAARGDLAGTLATYRDGLALRERMVEADPGNEKWQRHLSVSHEKVGKVLLAQGDLDGAVQSFRNSLDIRTRLTEADPSNARWQRDLIVSHSWLGDVLLAQARHAEALRSYQEGLAIADRLSTADPTNTVRQRDVSVLHEKIGNALVAQAKLVEASRYDIAEAERDQRLAAARPKIDEALTSFRACLVIRKRLAETDRNNARWQRDLTVAYERVGDALLAIPVVIKSAKQPLGASDKAKLVEALAAFREDLAIRERLAAADPENAKWQRDLSVAYNKIGGVLEMQGKYDAALDSFRDSLAIRTRLTETAPDNPGWQRDLAISHARIAKVMAKQGDTELAMRAFRKGRAIITELLEELPDHPRLIEVLEVLDEEIEELEQADAAEVPAPEQVSQ